MYLLPNNAMAAGVYWNNGNPVNYAPIAADNLAAYCGFSSVTNFVASRAFGSFAELDTYGISFDAVDPVDGLEYSYEYGLSGATNTQRIATKVLADSAPPTVNIGALSGPIGGVYTAVITISKATTDFTVADLSLTNATATLTGSGTGYTATLTPIAQGEITLSVGVGTFSDGAGNFNAVASDTVSAAFDSVAPTVAISVVPANITGVTTFAATFTFSEIVTGFTATDIVATNASVTVLAGSGTTYTATVAATGNGDVAFSLPAGMVTDLAGNANAAAAAVTIVDQTISQTQQVIASAMQARATS